MTEAVAEVRGWLSELVDQAVDGGEPVYLTRRGERVAAIVDAATLDRLRALAQRARVQLAAGTDPFSSDRDLADLGLLSLVPRRRQGRAFSWEGGDRATGGAGTAGRTG